MKEVIVTSLKETEELAYALAAFVRPPDVITLTGDLGVGKTTFTQAFAKGLGVGRTVSSPTFTILKQYEGKFSFNHLDVYRLENSEEDLGWDELFFGNAISVVEWPQFIEEELPDAYLSITIEYVEENQRKFRFQPIGERFVDWCKELGE